MYTPVPCDLKSGIYSCGARGPPFSTVYSLPPRLSSKHLAHVEVQILVLALVSQLRQPHTLRRELRHKSVLVFSRVLQPPAAHAPTRTAPRQVIARDAGMRHFRYRVTSSQ